LTKTMFC